MIIRYPTNGGPALQLSSGPIYTAHADFMNGWVPAKLAALVRGLPRHRQVLRWL